MHEALRLWPAQRRDVEYAELLPEVARHKTFSTDYAGARAVAEQGLELAEEFDNPRLQALALEALARIGSVESPTNEVVEMLDRGERLTTRASDWPTVAAMCLSRGLCWAMIGELERSRVDRLRSVEIYLKIGRLREAAWAGDENYTSVCMMLGRWAEEREAARDACQRAPELDSFYLPWMSGEFEVACRILRMRIDRARPEDDVQTLAVFLSVLAEFCLELGRCAEAELAAREAASLIHTRGYQSRMYRTAGALAEAAVCTGASDAERIVSEGDALVTRLGLHAGRPQLLVQLGTNGWPFSRGLGRRHVAWFGVVASKASGGVRARLSQSSPAPTSPRERCVILECRQPYRRAPAGSISLSEHRVAQISGVAGNMDESYYLGDTQANGVAAVDSPSGIVGEVLAAPTA